jgi:Na+/citrate or Na+/malate symporter
MELSAPQPTLPSTASAWRRLLAWHVAPLPLPVYVVAVAIVVGAAYAGKLPNDIMVVWA